MNRRNVLYLAGTAGALVLFLTTSYGALFFASVVGVAVLASILISCIAILSVSERVGHVAVRIWNAVIPAHVTHMLFRQ